MVWRTPPLDGPQRCTLTISQENFSEELVKKFGMTSLQNVPLRVGLKLEEFDENEKTESWPFRELVGGLMWLVISTHPNPFNDWGGGGDVKKMSPFWEETARKYPLPEIYLTNPWVE